MQSKFLLFAAVFITLIACKQDPKKAAAQDGAAPHANTTSLAGNWIAFDFVSRAAQYGSVLGAMNNAHVPYVYAVTFDPNFGDSVLCFNGMEEYKLPIEIRVDTIELKGARQGKSVFLVFDSQAQGEKKMTMFDGTTNKTYMDGFIKSNATGTAGYKAFLTALNHNLLKGQFESLRKGAANGNVQFTPGGWIQNLKDFDRFELCTAGDCFVTSDNLDVITLSNSKKENSEQFFGYRYSAQNDTLTIYKLINQNPEEKGVYAEGGIAYQFLRKIVE